MRDINYLIAIDTRYIGEAARRRRGRASSSSWSFRFMNSYLRATLNARDVRTAYNVLNQYRLLVEAMLRTGNGDDRALEGVQAHDLLRRTQLRHEAHLRHRDRRVRRRPRSASIAQRARRARKRTTMLARCSSSSISRCARSSQETGAARASARRRSSSPATTCSPGEERRRATIADDMARRAARAAARRSASSSSASISKDFWEIIDRGRNFEFMPPEQRECMKTFFSWLPLGDVDVKSPKAHN